ncbi:hypothetical protein F511_08065 [Dorcoceras hygrometricum]|uniref:Uncharacterized protein n=1 Tax=Dorcoceras hygrometricum TaxID=472368 RepID=A0A2Z7D094_9LAMI|nr:hypothetical protein F511_08065 [Dorcoceras hygrometricum]
MAFYLISSSHHVDFDSVFGMDAALVQVFESLIATGLKEFLGCPAVFYEAALTEFFTNGSVREDGMVVSAIRGTTVEISESMFAAAFELPTEGLTDLSDIPKNIVFDARSLFSESKEQLLDEHPSSASTSDTSSMRFDGTGVATTVLSLPATASTAPDVTEALNQLRASIEHIREKDDDAKFKDYLLMHLRYIKKNFTARFDSQDRVLGALRTDSNDQRTLLLLETKSSQRQLSTQIAAAAFDTFDTRRVVKELDAKINSLDEQVAAIRCEQFEFQSKIAADLLSLSTQIGGIVDYLRGGDAKNGEGSSSRRPLPTPAHQSEGSGDVVRTTEISQGVIDNAQRDILERMMRADRERER